jgi:hypothetical protein
VRAKFTVVTPPTRVRTIVRNTLNPVLVSAAHGVRNEWRGEIPHDWPGKAGVITNRTADDLAVDNPQSMRAVISTGTVSGKSLERGAREHEIWPRGFYPLKWPASRGGYPNDPDNPDGLRVRWPSVTHPGVRPRYYGWKVLMRRKASIQGLLQQAIGRIP